MKNLRVSAAEGKKRVGNRRLMAHLDLHDEAAINRRRNSKQNDTVSFRFRYLPKRWEAACVQSLKKLLAVVLKLEMSGPCSSVG